MRFSKAEREDYLNVIDRYCLATGQRQYELREVYDWAAARNEFDMSSDAVRRVHLAGLRDACQSDTVKDEQGHKVRLRMCVETVSNGDTDEPVQRTLWSECTEADSPFLIEALHQQYNRVRADVESLKAQQRYLNSIFRSRGEREIQLVLDFSDRDGEEYGPA